MDNFNSALCLLTRDDFPHRDFTGDNPKQGVNSGLGSNRQLGQPPWIADFKFAREVYPFILDLAAGDGKGLNISPFANLAAIETIATMASLCMNSAEIGGDGCAGTRRFKKSHQLWVMLVATRPSQDHCLCQKCFSPQRDQAPGIQILGMERPKTHVSYQMTKCR